MQDKLNILRRIRYLRRRKSAFHKAELEAIQQLFVDANIGLVLYWVGRFKKRSAFHDIQTEELVQEASIELLRAIDMYRSKPNCGFSTFAGKMIRKRLQHYGQKSHASLGSSFPPDKLDSRGIGRAVEQPSTAEDAIFDYAVEAERRAVVTEAVAQLDDLSKDVISSRFGIGKPEETRGQIAARLSISLAKVRYIEDKVLRFLKNSPDIISLQ